MHNNISSVGLGLFASANKYEIRRRFASDEQILWEVYFGKMITVKIENLDLAWGWVV